MFKIGISILFFSAIAMANIPVIGQILTSNGSPLAYAVIADNTDQKWVIADENGKFYYYFAAVTSDTLSVSRYGYQSGKLIIVDKSYYSVSLTPDPIQQKEVIVSGEDYFSQGQITNTYRLEIGNDNPQKTFQQIPGITIRSYGGRAGIMTISTNGSPAVNTKIILDDIDLTSAQNGETDLSQIPETFFSNVTVANSPGILYGSGAVDGVLRISPQNQKTYFSASSGSFGLGSLSGNINKNWSKWSANLSFGYLTDDGNYKYSICNIDTSRTNNDFERKYITFRVTGRISEKSNLSAMLLESKQIRGVAGSVEWPSTEARRKDHLRLANLTYNQLHKDGYSKLQLSYRKSYENYNDPNPWWPIASTHDIYSSIIRFQHHNNIWNDISGTFLYEGKVENLKSTDVGDHQRYFNSFASIGTIPVWDKINLFPAMRFDISGNYELNPTADFRAIYNANMNSVIEYHFGTGFRYPTLNDLYWQPGGNPELNPEKSKYHTIKYRLYWKADNFSNFYFNIGNKITDDLIQWVPIDESYYIWQPQNIASSSRTNLTIGGQYDFEIIPLQISGHFTYQKTKNIDLNKQLLYAPQYIGFIGLSFNHQTFRIGVQTHYTGSRLAAYGHHDDTYLPDYWYTSISLEYKTEVFGNLVLFKIDVKNLLDAPYMSINSYPEPGRIVNFGIKYELSK